MSSGPDNPGITASVSTRSKRCCSRICNASDPLVGRRDREFQPPQQVRECEANRGVVLHEQDQPARAVDRVVGLLGTQTPRPRRSAAPARSRRLAFADLGEQLISPCMLFTIERTVASPSTGALPRPLVVTNGVEHAVADLGRDSRPGVDHERTTCRSAGRRRRNRWRSRSTARRLRHRIARVHREIEITCSRWVGSATPRRPKQSVVVICSWIVVAECAPQQRLHPAGTSLRSTTCSSARSALREREQLRNECGTAASRRVRSRSCIRAGAPRARSR